MNKNLRYLWLAVAIILAFIAFTLISATGSGLQEDHSFLPLVVRAADTPTPPPTPKPTVLPTVLPPAQSEDGFYYSDLVGEVEGYIRFRVKDNGGTVNNAAFIYRWNNLPGCGTMGRSFPGPQSISHGKFSFAAADLIKILASMECTEILSRRAFCNVQEIDYGGPWHGACGRLVGKLVQRQN